MSIQVKSRRAAVVEQVQELGVVAVIRIKDPAKLRAVVDALVEGGVRALEVTMTVPGAVDLIRELAPTMPPGFLLGAGTVTSAETARAVIDAGATYVVSPVFHTAGTGWVYLSLTCGSHLVLLRDPDPSAILRALAEHRVTHEGATGSGCNRAGITLIGHYSIIQCLRRR